MKCKTKHKTKSFLDSFMEFLSDAADSLIDCALINLLLEGLE